MINSIASELRYMDGEMHKSHETDVTAFMTRLRFAARIMLATIAYAWLASVLLQTPNAKAHALEQSYVFLNIDDERIEGYFELAVADVNQVLGLDFRTDLSVTIDEAGARLNKIVPYVLERVSFKVNAKPVAVRITGHGLQNTSFAQFMVIKFAFEDLVEPAQVIDVDYKVFLDELPGHRGLLVVTHNWKANVFDNEKEVSLIFSAADHAQQLDLSENSFWRGFRGMLTLGMHHIATGTDHILFLLALILPCVVARRNSAWEPVHDARTALVNVVKIVTVFTLAHSITLALAALDIAAIPSRVVESVIAISIAIAAFDILIPIFRHRVGWIVFGFGLFHGFGFASVLVEMGIPNNYLVPSLLGFNIGVEMGQLILVFVAFPFLYAIRSMVLYRRLVLPASAIGLIVIALYWFTERAFEIDLPAGAILNQLLALVLWKP